MDIEKVAEEKEEKQEEKENRETKEVQTAEIKTKHILQKSPKKMKTVQCKVMLLDGTEYSCDLEVRHRVSGERALFSTETNCFHCIEV